MGRILAALFRAAANLGLRRTLAVVVSFVLLLPIGMSQGVRELRLTLDGVEILATVIATHEVPSTARGPRQQNDIRIDFVFEAPAGGWVSGSDTIPLRLWDRNGRPGQVPVRVLPADPQVHEIKEFRPGFQLAGYAVMMAFALWQVVPGLRAFRHAWQVERLLVDPVWREARVSGIAEVPRLIGTDRYLEWRDPAGRIGRSHMPLDHGARLKVGDPIRVLVDPFGGRSHWDYET